MKLKYSSKNKKLILGAVLTALVLLPAVIGLFWLPYDPETIDNTSRFLAPSLKHIFGTDNMGRDIFSRIAAGTASTFKVAIISVAWGGCLGIVTGALTGYFGGPIDEILMRVNDTLASFPSILLALVAVSILGNSDFSICLVLGILFIPGFSRIIRSEFISERGKDYVQNARLMGAGNLRIIFVHILPNTKNVLVSTFLVGLNNAILAEAGLGYLGLGVQPPTPSLGRMLSEAQVFIFSAPWYVVSDCAVMVVALFGISLIGENFGVSGVSLSSVKRKLKRLKAENEKKQGNAEAAQNTAKKQESSDVLLRVEDLSVSYIDDEGLDETISDIYFEVKKGEVLGVVGESGSGKSLLASGIMGILPEKAFITEGKIYFADEKISTGENISSKNGNDGFIELTGLKEREYVHIRGGRIAMVFQEPQTALNPLLTIGEQLDEVLDLHHPEMTAGEQRTRILEVMADTGLDNVNKLYDKYPHELSGGMKQRICIAMAILGGAELILADEPTTALDKDTEKIVLEIFRELNRKYNIAIILISHDLEVIGTLCDRIIVMHDGKLEEELELSPITERTGSVEERFSNALLKKDYTKKLLEAAFADKTYKAIEEESRDNIVELKDYCVSYKVYAENRGIFGKPSYRKVISNLNLEIKRGTTFGIVGKSGSGKSTLVKAIAGINKLTEGEMKLNTDSPAMVFQDPASSLNPSMSVGRLLKEAILLTERKNKTPGAKAELCGESLKTGEVCKLNKAQIRKRILGIMNEVGLSDELLKRKPSELSGGQRQRVAIALALLQKHELIILDEPVSAVDVTIREQIIELLMELKKQHDLTYILISHDRRLVGRVCDAVLAL